MSNTGIYYPSLHHAANKGEHDNMAKTTDQGVQAATSTRGERAQSGDMRGFYNLSRNLVATNTLDVLLDSIVLNTVEILHVSFARLLMLEANGQFVCSAARTASSNHPNHKHKPEPPHVQLIYQKVMRGRSPYLITRDDKNLTSRERQSLGLAGWGSLCLVPLRVDSDLIGILVIGEETPTPQSFEDEMLQMAAMIGEQAASAIHRVRLRHRLQESSLNTVLALAKTIEAHDPYTGGHGRRLTRLAEETARQMGFSELDLQTIRWAALLHDIGKISISADVLTRPGPLTDNEWQQMRQHPQIGAEIVLMVSELADVAGFIRAHHERFDGSGYPYGLKRDEIPLGARILAVIDAYSAMTDGRVYRAPRTHAEAIDELRRCAGKDFDPRVVTAFLKLFELGKLSEISQD